MDTPVSATMPRFEPLATPSGLRVIDPIDGESFTFLTPEQVEPEPVSTDALPVPVDGAAAVETKTLRTPYLIGVWIRDDDFGLIEQCNGGEHVSLPPDRYIVEFSSVQFKLYLEIEGSLTVDATDETIEIHTPKGTSVVIGLRSYHEQPARTITTTSDPRDVMTAISQFRAALKTTSPERSFPTLRGHPPLFEHGETLSIPDESELSPASLTIELPPELSVVLPAAPLAYYLDADLVPGKEPLLHAAGKTVSLVGPEGYEQRVATVLKHVFTLDCVVRTEGLYDADLHERSLLEDQIDLDFERLYDLPLPERTAAYLEVPFETVEPAWPAWKLTADVEPVADNIGVLPFLVSDLATIRVPGEDGIEAEDLSTTSPALETFFGGNPDADGDATTLRGATDGRSEAAHGDATVADRVFRPEPVDSLMCTFVGDGIPLGATKMTPAMFHRRLERDPAESGRVTVDVVVNETAMDDETSVSEVYGARDWIDFDVTIHENLTRHELADVLKRDIDFLHYIGHVDDDGFTCADEPLDARTLPSVGIGGFLLNACNSYEQGRALVEAGAVGGIVTLATIPNPTATHIGRHLARLLNAGFPLATARSIIEADERLANRYMVIGDGNTNVAKSQSGAPYLVEITDLSEEGVTFTIRGYPTVAHSLGGLRTWHSAALSQNHVNPTVIKGQRASREEFERALTREEYPVLYDGELTWSSDFRLD